MNWQAILDLTTSARLPVTLLHSVWEVALVAAVAWLLGKSRRRNVESAYTIHVAALVLGLAAVPITYLLIPNASPMEVATNLATQDPSLVARPPGPPPHQVTERPTTRVFDQDASGAVEDLPTVLTEEAIARTGTAIFDWPRLAAWINAAYCCGVLAMLARLLVGTWQAHRWCAASQPAENIALARKLNSLAREWRLRVVPLLLSAERAIVPKVMGVLRPVIVFPAAALAALTPDELEMILIHELAHVKRYDMWVNLVQRLAEAALFFNPALWYLSRRISTLREYCCDELTCRSVDCPPPHCGVFVPPRVRYAQALLRVVELSRSRIEKRSRSSGSHSISDLAALAASGRSPSELRRRVARLFGEPLSEPLKMSRSGLVFAGLVLALVCLTSTLWPASPSATAQSTAAAETKPDAALAQIPDSIKELIRAVEQNEKPYENIEFTLKEVYEQPPHNSEQLLTIIRDGVKFRREASRTASNVPVAGMGGGGNLPSQIDLQTTTDMDAFDGISHRSFSELTMVNVDQPSRVQTTGLISDKQPSLTNLARPHMLLLEGGWPNVPLSTYLSGPEAIRSFPAYGYFSPATLIVRDLGADQFRGLRCRKVFVEYWSRERRTHGTELWLAEDRNLIPARIISYTYRESPDLAVAEHKVDEWKELRPGVWFPMKTHTDRYDGDTLRRENKQVVSWVRTYEVTSASLEPKTTLATFTQLEFPPGTKVRVEKDGKSTETTQLEQNAADPGEPQKGANGAQGKNLGPSFEPERLLARLKERDRQFDNRSVEVDQVFQEHIDAVEVVKGRNLMSLLDNWKGEAGPHVDEPLPVNPPQPYDQAHRFRQRLTARGEEIAIEFLGDQERQFHPEFSRETPKGSHIVVARGAEQWYVPPDSFHDDPRLNIRSSARSLRNTLEWTCGYGFARWMTRINSVEAAGDRVKVVGQMRLFEDDLTLVKLELDRDLIVRSALVSIRAKPDGFHDLLVETEGTVRPDGVPPVAAEGWYRSIRRPAAGKETKDEDDRYRFAAVSKPLSDEGFRERTSINPQFMAMRAADLRINDFRNAIAKADRKYSTGLRLTGDYVTTGFPSRSGGTRKARWNYAWAGGRHAIELELEPPATVSGAGLMNQPYLTREVVLEDRDLGGFFQAYKGAQDIIKLASRGEEHAFWYDPILWAAGRGFRQHIERWSEVGLLDADGLIPVKGPGWLYSKAGTGRWELWVDPQADYIVRRALFYAPGLDGKDVLEARVENKDIARVGECFYAKHGEFIDSPESRKIAFNVTFTRASLENDEQFFQQARSHFVEPYPANSYVQDSRSGKEETFSADANGRRQGDGNTEPAPAGVAPNRTELMRFFAEDLTNAQRKMLSEMAPADFEAELAKMYSASKTQKAPADAAAKTDETWGYVLPTKVFGRAIDAAGSPISGATIYLVSTNGVNRELGQATTDKDGRYEFPSAQVPIRRSQSAEPQGTIQVFGTAKDHAFAWHGMRFVFDADRPNANQTMGDGTHDSFYRQDEKRMDLKFERPASLKGEVLDEFGLPVAGAVLRIVGCDYLDKADREGHQNFREFWAMSQSPVSMRNAKTDEHGAFELVGLPPETACWIFLEHPDYARVTFYAATTARPITTWDSHPLLTGKLQLKLVAPRTVVVRATAGAAGKPLAGALAGAYQMRASGPGASGKTDPVGRVTLRLPPGEYKLNVDPPTKDDNTFVRTNRPLTVAADQKEQQVDFRVDDGCVLILSAVDADTLEPIPGVSFWYEREPGTRMGVEANTWQATRAETDKTGKFRAVVYPGERKYGVGWSPMPDGYDDANRSIEKALKLPAGETVETQFLLRKKDRQPAAKNSATRAEETRAMVASSQPAEAPAQPAPAPAQPTATAPPGPGEYAVSVTISGRALDDKGQPIAGAQIYLASQRPGYKRIAETKSEADGSYLFEKVALPIQRAETNRNDDAGQFEVFGTAPGYALAWRPRKDFHPGRKQVRDTFGDSRLENPPGYGTDDPMVLDLTFRPPQTIRGRIVDDLLQPIAGATLAIRFCDSEWDNQDGSTTFRGSLNSLNERDTVPPEVKVRTTGADGRFEFTGLPADYRWNIDVRAPDFAPTSIAVVTHDGVPPKRQDGKPIYNGDFEVMLQRPRMVRYRVVYDDTGKPAEKVGLSSSSSVTTDADGLAEMRMVDGKTKVLVLPRYGSLYLATQYEEITVSAETAKEPITFRLKPAVVVDITVRDADTGQPLEGVDVWRQMGPSSPVSRNRDVHFFRSWEVEKRRSHVIRQRTDANGKMRVLFEPGKTRFGVGLDAFPKGYAPVEPDGLELDLQPGNPFEVDFQMRKPPAANAAGAAADKN